MIRVKPARRRRTAFAKYVAAQPGGGRMLTEDTFGVRDHVYTHMPERLLLGAVVEGHKYVPVAPEPLDELDELPPGDDLIVGGYELEDEAPADDSGESDDPSGLDEPADSDPADGDYGFAHGNLDASIPAPRSVGEADRPACPICNKPMLNAKGVATHLRRRHPEHTEGEES